MVKAVHRRLIEVEYAEDKEGRDHEAAAHAKQGPFWFEIRGDNHPQNKPRRGEQEEVSLHVLPLPVRLVDVQVLAYGIPMGVLQKAPCVKRQD